MKISLANILVFALATETVVASSWFAKAPYNKWHETELERWLSDHDVPFPKAADRKDLQDIVQRNWQSAIESPYLQWDTKRLSSYLKSQGREIEKGAEQNKDALLSQVKSSWHDADAQAHSTYDDVKSWIFNSWSDSHLKAFLDRNGIPAPQPYNTDKAKQVARENYQSAADKVGATAAYPGNWIYESWTDSDLKIWLDKHGIVIPGATSREKMVASVRRNSYLARNNIADYASAASSSGSSVANWATDSAASAASVASKSGSSVANWATPSAASLASSAASVASKSAASAASVASKSASSVGNWAPGSAASLASRASASGGSLVGSATDAAYSAASSLGDKLFDTWSDSQLKEWADKNGVKVPQGSRRNEVLSILRKQAAKLTGDNASASLSSGFGAATSKAGNEYASATNGIAYSASSYVNHYFTEFEIFMGIRNNYASTASDTVSSAYNKATAAVKGEL